MRFVNKGAVATPGSLMPGGAGDDELVKAREYRTNPPAIPAGKKKREPFKYKAYKEDDVQETLEGLFHGKCAYCETYYAASAPMDVDHYRPKGKVADDLGHGGYWWIAMAWENLLPSCIDCNRMRGQVLVEISPSLEVLARTTRPPKVNAGKKDSFPLAAAGVRAIAEAKDFSAELPLLLNPCVDDPAQCLAFAFDPQHPVGLLMPVGDLAQRERGAVSIQIYGLNRQGLVEDRTRLLRQLEFLGNTAISLAKIETGDAAAPARAGRDAALAQIKALKDAKEPYSAMVEAWFEGFKQRFAGGGGGND